MLLAIEQEAEEQDGSEDSDEDDDYEEGSTIHHLHLSVITIHASLFLNGAIYMNHLHAAV